MFFPYGVLANLIAILAGGSIGTLFGLKISERIQNNVFMAIGLSVGVLGISLSLKGDFLLVSSCVVFGTIIGTLLKLDVRIEAMGGFLKGRMKSSNPKFIEGFVSATLIFGIGSMAVLGPLQEAFEGNMELMLTKSMLDFFTSIMLASTFGFGVAMSAIPVFVYELVIFLFAPQLAPVLSAYALDQLLGAGGIMIIGISINILGIKNIPLANFFPALVLVVIVANLVK